LSEVFPKKAFWVRSQATLSALDSFSEPDLAVLRGARYAGKGIPDASTALLVVEISDTTLLFDTTIKASLYAAAGVPEYWVLNIPDRTLIVHREPIVSTAARFGVRYGNVRDMLPGTKIAPLCASEALFDPAELLPPLTPAT